MSEQTFFLMFISYLLQSKKISASSDFALVIRGKSLVSDVETKLFMPEIIEVLKRSKHL